jgi:hypothetical protein
MHGQQNIKILLPIRMYRGQISARIPDILAQVFRIIFQFLQVKFETVPHIRMHPSTYLPTDNSTNHDTIRT